MKIKYCVLMVFFISLSYVYAYFEISEVMYNPLDGNEWVEIYNIGQNMTLQGGILSDNHSSDELGCCPFNVICPEMLLEGERLLIVDQDSSLYENLNHSDGVLFLCVDDNSLGNGLGNSGDIIIISFGDNSSNISYGGGILRGNSLSLIDGSYVEGMATPGEPNEVFYPYDDVPEEDVEGSDLMIESILESPAIVGMEYVNLFKVTNLFHVSGNTDNISVVIIYNISKDDSIVDSGESRVHVNSYTSSNTGRAVFYEGGNYTICGRLINMSIDDQNSGNDKSCRMIEVLDTKGIPCNVSLHVRSDKVLYDVGEKVFIYNELCDCDYPFVIEYWIEDLFGNVIKNPVNTTNLNAKSYTASTGDSDAVYFIKSRLSGLFCNDSSFEDNQDEQMIVIRGEEIDEELFTIDRIYLGSDGSVRFGDIVKVKLDLCKADSTKSSVKLWVGKDDEKISYVSYINLYDDHKCVSTSVPIMLKSNCNGKYPDGTYRLFVSGLDIEVNKGIKVSGRKSGICGSSSKSGQDEDDLTDNKKGLIYDLYSVEKNNLLSEDFSFGINIENNDDEDHSFLVYSYIYRGSKSYSGERELNQKKISVKAGESKEVGLKNNISSIESGKYKLKVRIYKDNLTTPSEFTRNVSFFMPAGKNEIETGFLRPVIKSFSVDTKSESGEIFLVAEFDDISSRNHVILINENGVSRIDAGSGEIRVPIVVGKGNEMQILKLMDNDTVLDVKELMLSIDQGNVTYYSEEEMIISLYEGALITGNTISEGVIYESPSAKASKIAPVLLIVSVIMAGFGFFKMRKKEE